MKLVVAQGGWEVGVGWKEVGAGELLGSKMEFWCWTSFGGR